MDTTKDIIREELGDSYISSGDDDTGFLNLQQHYDLEIWKDRQEELVKKVVHPYREAKPHSREKGAV